MQEETHNGVRYFVRFIHNRDVLELVKIETSQDFCSTEEELRKVKQRRDVVGMVLEIVNKASQLKVIGFAFYELHNKHNRLIRFVIHHEYRRRGWGRQLMEKLVARLSPAKRNRLVVEVRESNLEAQLFLKAVGFKGVSVTREYFSDTKEDAFVMVYQVGNSALAMATAAVVQDDDDSGGDDYDVYVNEGAD